MFSKNFLLNLWVGSEILLTMMGCDKKTPYQQKFYYGDSVKVLIVQFGKMVMIIILHLKIEQSR